MSFVKIQDGVGTVRMSEYILPVTQCLLGVAYDF